MEINKSGRIDQCAIALTYGCNLHCDFCFEKGAAYRSQSLMDFGNLRQLVDFCGEINVRYLFFSGGEPLTYPYLIDILRYISQNHTSITSTIATNALLLDDFEFCRRLCDSGLGYVDVSLKGANARDWKRVTGVDGFERQLKAIRNLSLMTMEFTCSMVITHDNVMRICDAVQLAHDHGARQFSFTFFIDNSDAEEKNSLYLNKHNPVRLIEAFVSQVPRLNAITQEWWIEYSFPMCLYADEHLRLLKGKIAEPCYVHLGNAMVFSPDMELLICDMLPNVSLGRFGRDFSTYPEFKELLQNSESQLALNKLRKWPSSKCDDCEYLPDCCGGCPILWKNYSFDALMEFKSNNVNC